MRWYRLVTVAAAAGVLSGCGGTSVPRSAAQLSSYQRMAASAHAYSQSNDIPPRLQWNGNDGYFGEVSLISAGLYYGQYVSQYDARVLDGSGLPQYKSRSQLLIGVNDTVAAANMHLEASEWDTKTETSTAQFLTWVQQEVLSGYPVAIGIFTNEYLFYGKTNPNAGDPQYDHIVPVTGVTPATLTFSDNGLWTGTTGKPTYTFTYPLSSFPKTRQEANAKNGTIYSVANGGQNYGVAITGVIDQDRETLPVRVATNVNYEKPAIANGSNVRPAPMALTLTITVSGLEPGTTYNLYRYDAMANVPNAAFNANASQATERWTIDIASGTTYTMSENIMSDDEAIYRAVPSAAP